MNLAYRDAWLEIWGGDCRTVLAELPDESVHCVVTSPPYWGLRDYGTAAWEGGDEACRHEGDQRWYTESTAATSSAGAFSGPGEANKERLKAGRWREKGTCVKCGAVHSDNQLGLEPTPEQYVENMVAVFREVRRVLRSDGTVWLNLGDSYNSAKGNPGPNSTDPKQAARRGWVRPNDWGIPGLKPKDLVGIPWRVAFALQADGWYLRSDIIWSKPNPMPESVTDRPTKSHEYVFLLAKSPRYYFDADAVREPHARLWDATTNGGSMATNRHHDAHVGGSNRHERDYPVPNPAGRNIRTVWTVATQPYPGAHFAVFPEKLIEPCILAGCPVDGVILDPFGGSGTTARVANRLSRRAILIDLNPDYLKQQMDRNRDLPLGLGA